MHSRRLQFLFVLLSITLPLGAQPQDDQPITGSVTGMVVNKSTLEPIVGANVIVVGTQYGASTGVDGMYSIPGVPAGTYQLRISIIGFVPVLKTDVVVRSSRPADIDVELEESKVEIGEVSITADYFQKTPDIPLSTQLQTNEEIRRLPGGFEDVVRAVSILPGVAQVESGRNDLIVRGGAPSENLYIVEGIELQNINHFATQGAAGGPLSYVNLDFIEGTTFSAGGFGVRYGDKLSSVLNIDLRHGREDRLGGKLAISATQFGLNLEGPTSDDGSFLFSARRSYLDLIFKAAGFGFVPEYWDFLTKVSYRLSPRDELTVLGIGALDNVRLFNDTQDKRFDNSRILYSAQQQVVGGVRWQHLFGSGYTRITAGYTYNDYDTRQADSLLEPIFKNISTERSLSLRGELVLQLTRTTELTFGAQGQRLGISADLYLRPFRTAFGQDLSVNAYYDTSAWKAAIYAQASEVIGRFRLTAGGRIDYFNLLTNKHVFSPRTSVSYALSMLTNINLSVGRYYQAPSLIWLVSNPVNRSLNFIRADQVVVGMDHLLRSDTKVSIEAYYKRYEQYPVSSLRPYLVLANTGAGYGGSEEGFASFGLDPLESIGRGAAHGAELFVQKKLSEVPCYGLISLSYSESRFTAIDGVTRPSSYDQRWILNLGGGYVLDERWEFSTKFRLATGRPYTPYNADGTQSQDQYNSRRTSTNHSLDIRVDRRWQFRSWTLVTYIDVQNIYNQTPARIPRYNERLRRMENPDSIGILPSIGVSAEF